VSSHLLSCKVQPGVIMAPKQKSKSKSSANSPASQDEHRKPDWPLFQPLLPTSDLHLEELVPSQIVLIRNFWTPSLCKRYVQFLSSLPLVTTPGKPKRGEAVRVNDRFQVDDSNFAARLWNETGLCSLILDGALDEREQVAGAQRSSLWGGNVVSSLQYEAFSGD
jgi:hypothetical protein